MIDAESIPKRYRSEIVQLAALVADRAIDAYLSRGAEKAARDVGILLHRRERAEATSAFAYLRWPGVDAGCWIKSSPTGDRLWRVRLHVKDASPVRPWRQLPASLIVADAFDDAEQERFYDLTSEPPDEYLGRDRRVRWTVEGNTWQSAAEARAHEARVVGYARETLRNQAWADKRREAKQRDAEISKLMAAAVARSAA